MVQNNGTKKISVGLIQLKVSDNVSTNMQKAADSIKVAAERGAKIICLQELYRTKYFPRQRNKSVGHLAEQIPGESTALFGKLAKEYGIVIIAPLFERDAHGKFYNSAAVINENGEPLRLPYRKNHIPYDEFFYEKEYFANGDYAYPVYDTRYASFSVLICYDQWFPEPARISTLAGADIIFYPTAIGWIKDRECPEGDWHDAWETIQRSHAIANGVHVVAVNRVGEEEELKFWGGSFVSDPFGKVVGKASAEDEEILVVEIDLSRNKLVQDGWGFLENRRPETYEPLAHRPRKEISQLPPQAYTFDETSE